MHFVEKRHLGGGAVCESEMGDLGGVVVGNVQRRC